MMFACGDSSKPSLESAHLIERIVHQQLVSLLLQSQEIAEMREAKYIRTEDILFLLRKDKMKLRRAVKFLCK
jgi:transcription initiation protein SPT3